MIQELRERLADLGRTLDNKQQDICDFFDTEQLRAYFRTRDSLRLLVSVLSDLETAMYQHKILLG